MIRASWVARIRSRAGFRCEYCRLPEAAVLIPFEIEHIVPRQHGGRDLLGNLALSCLHCNRHKGPNIAGFDGESIRQPVRLFHPRNHHWPYHFPFDQEWIRGRTLIGRVTVQVLNMNSPLMVLLRSELIRNGESSSR